MTSHEIARLRLAIEMASRSRSGQFDLRILRQASSELRKAGWFPREMEAHLREAERLYRLALKRRRH